MTREEQQAIFDAIRERSDRPGTFSAVNGVRLTALCDGGAEGEVRLTAQHLNPLGIVHGGVYCTMMDQAAGTAACSRGSFCRTINCEVRFLAAAKSGRLTCYAEAVRMGKTIHVIRARVEDENGTVCADGVYTFRMKQMELPEVQ